jgi:hypothetical protein
MNKSLENELFESYAEILPKKKYPTGMPVDDGWYIILDTICYHIKRRINIVHWGYNHKEGEKMECRVSIVKMNRQPYGGRLTLEFDVDWILASPTQEVETELNTRLEELRNLVETWSDRTCEMSGRPGQNYVSIDDKTVNRVLDPNVARALNFVDESYHYEKQ